MKVYITNNYYNEPGPKQTGKQISIDFNYIKNKPEMIIRFICMFFAIVVFSCVAATLQSGVCMFALDSNACNYGIAVGVIAFLLALVYLILDVCSVLITTPSNRKAYLLSDAVLSSSCTLLWFIGFCYLTNRWTQMSRIAYNWLVSNTEAALTFSFFSIIAWGVLTFFTMKQYRAGTYNNFMPSNIGEDYEPIVTTTEAPSSASTASAPRSHSSSNVPETNNYTPYYPYDKNRASTEATKPYYGTSPYQGGGFAPYQANAYPPYQGQVYPPQNTETSGAFGNSSNSGNISPRQ